MIKLNAELLYISNYIGKCDKINENEKAQLTKMKASKDGFLGYVDENAAKLQNTCMKRE